MAAQLKFAKMHLNKVFWDDVVWTDEMNIWRKSNTAYQNKHVTPAEKHGGGGVMIWAGFVFTGIHFVIIELTMNSSVYQSVLESNARASVQELKPG